MCPIHKVNSINLKMIHARDAYAYALALMDILFTPAEMSSSLLFASKRSLRPTLDIVKVEKLLGKHIIIDNILTTMLYGVPRNGGDSIQRQVRPQNFRSEMQPEML